MLPLLLASRLALGADPLLHAPITARSTDCAARVRELDARVTAAPGDAAARIERATCLYRVGRIEWARDDIVAAASGREVEPALLHDGDVLRVVVLARVGDLRGAKAALDAAKAAWGETAGTVRADALYGAAGGDRAGGWKKVDDSLSRWPDNPHATWLAAEMTALDPRHATAAALRAVEAPAASSEDYAFNRAVAALGDRRYEDCLREVDAPANTGLLAETRQRLARLGHICAVEAGRLDEADRLLSAAGGSGKADAAAVVGHAEREAKAGRADRALQVLAEVAPADPVDVANVATLRVRLHTEAGRLDEALEAAGPALPRSRANLAVALKQAGRFVEAAALLRATCPNMQGADAARCYDTLERWEK